MAEGGAATATGSTKVNKMATVPVAACGLKMPQNKTAKPTIPMAATASTGWVEHAVPMLMKAAPTKNVAR